LKFVFFFNFVGEELFKGDYIGIIRLIIKTLYEKCLSKILFAIENIRLFSKKYYS